MTLTSFIQSSNAFLPFLAEAALRTLILAACAGLGLALFRVKSSLLRLFTWTGVLYAALGMPLMIWLVPAAPVSLPSFFEQEEAAPVAVESRPFGAGQLSLADQSASRPMAVQGASGNLQATNNEISPGLRIPASRTSEAYWSSLPWRSIATCIYSMITLLLLARLAAGSWMGRRLVARSRRVCDSRVTKRVQAYLAGRNSACEVVESDYVTVPVTVGALRPAILLPAGWQQWDETKLHAVLAHELSHVTRRDAFTQFLSRLHRAIFWFSPLAWWLDRQLNVLAEQASDEAALSGGVDRAEYARTLLGFFESIQSAPGRVWWQGVSMAKVGQAEHRLERILSWRGVMTMGVKKSVLVAIAALGLPVVYLVAAVRPANHNVVMTSSAQEPVPATEPALPSGIPPAPALAPVAPGAPVHGAVAMGVLAPANPAVPAEPATPAAPAALWSGQSHSYGAGHSNGYSYAYGFDNDQRFVIVSGKTDSLTMSGSSQDAEHVQKLRKQIPGDFIWFQRDEKSYIIRNQATIDHARKLWAPQEELGKKQEELGKQQEALGKQQEELGSKMEQVRVNVPDMTAQLDALKAKLQKLGPSATVEQLGDLQSEIGELQSKLGELQSHAGDEQGKFGSQMGELGAKQGKLGEEQGQLGKQQAELAEKANREMKSLLDEAIKNGTAKPEADTSDGGTI
jgi:beta-lactamase regulating signal transducer with metallopeptidase domain